MKEKITITEKAIKNYTTLIMYDCNTVEYFCHRMMRSASGKRIRHTSASHFYFYESSCQYFDYQPTKFHFLLSYDTPILALITVEGHVPFIIPLYEGGYYLEKNNYVYYSSDDISVTTSRHIREFTGLSKLEYITAFNKYYEDNIITYVKVDFHE